MRKGQKRTITAAVLRPLMLAGGLVGAAQVAHLGAGPAVLEPVRWLVVPGLCTLALALGVIAALRGRRACRAEDAAEPAAVVETAVAPAEAAAAEPAPVGQRARVSLWVLSIFVAVGALVTISAHAARTDSSDLLVAIPLALFWTLVIAVGFALRAALLRVRASVTRRVAVQPAGGRARVARRGSAEALEDSTFERLARIVRIERQREAMQSRIRLLHPAE